MNACKIKRQVSLLSLPPTILSLTMNRNFSDFLGKDKVPLIKYGIGGEEYVISEGCEKNKNLAGPKAINKRISCRSQLWKYIYNYDGKEELYSLTEDPRERLNVVDEEKRIAKDFRKKILEHLKTEEATARRMKEAKRVRELIKKKGL